jgi:hypothetical protein
MPPGKQKFLTLQLEQRVCCAAMGLARTGAVGASTEIAAGTLAFV